jgi:hypothetical protein
MYRQLLADMNDAKDKAEKDVNLFNYFKQSQAREGKETQEEETTKD